MYKGMFFVAGWLAAAFLNVGFALAVVLAIAVPGAAALVKGQLPKMLGMGEAQPYGQLPSGTQKKWYEPKGY